MAALGRNTGEEGGRLRNVLVAAALLAGMAASVETAEEGPEIVLDNARVRVIRAGSVLPVADHPAAVVVVLKDDLSHKMGEAYWSGDPESRLGGQGGDLRSILIVEPKKPVTTPNPVTSEAGTKPGQGAFVGISFRPLFENDRVSVIRGRMEVGAQEAFHTHGQDIVLVHLTGGTIEDTADASTRVNRFKNGDVEFEARGTSHSARNLGPPLEAILVTLKP